MGTLAGSLASPWFRAGLSVRAILLLELWMWLGLWLVVAWPNVYVLTAAMLPWAIAAPVTDSVVVGYRLAITPDALLGRVESVRSSISLLVVPLLAGVLLSTLPARAAIAVFAAAGLALALWGTASRSLRAAPSLTDLAPA